MDLTCNSSINKEIFTPRYNRTSQQIYYLENDLLDIFDLEGDCGKKFEIDEEIKKTLMKKGEFSTCKLITKNEKGTGFFCQIPYNGKKIKVLMTNYNIIDENLLKIGSVIKCSYHKQIKKIEITKNRMYWTNPNLDYTCIEILSSDNIEDFFEIENENYINFEEEYLNEDIAILQYPNRGFLKVIGGCIEKIYDKYIEHSVITYKGSTGSPIVLLLRDFKIIGIHKHFDLNKQINIGILMKDIIKDINKNYFISEYIINENLVNQAITILNYDDTSLGNLFFKSDLQRYCDLYLNDVKINFCLNYNFKKEGKYKIKGILKNTLSDLSYMFYNCLYLKSLDLSNFNSNKVNNMQNMFSICCSLTSLNLTNFTTRNVTNMEKMFYKCSSLVSLDLSSFNTDNVTDMSWMFSSCSSLSTLDLSNFNTINVIDMNNMFSECSSLISLNLSNFNTINVENIYSMFFECSSLTYLDLSNFNTINVESMYFMFYNCNSLTFLNISNFDTSNVINMNGMFCDCSSLKSLNLSNFKTSKVKNMRKMFYNCSSLTNLDLTNFSTSFVNNMELMFFGCRSLTILNLSNFNSINVSKMDHMFSGIKKHCSLNCKDKRIIEEFKKKF